jgi:hypothetical protein
MGLCNPLPNADAAENVAGWVEGALETMTQYGYPYPTNFYNPVPGYPFKVACEGMLAAGTGLGALRAAADVYYNYTGQAGKCYGWDAVVQGAVEHWSRSGQRHKLHQHELRNRQATATGAATTRVEGGNAMAEDGSGSRQHLRWAETQEGWGYQCCTEVYQPMPTNGVTDFLRPSTPDKQQYFADCQHNWGVVPRPDWEEMTFMGSHISAGSNIFLASGQLDPWRAAGIQETPKGSPSSIIVRVIENGAHHFDLRASNPLDPPSVTAVRNEERAAMKAWIAEWKAIYG